MSLSNKFAQEFIQIHNQQDIDNMLKTQHESLETYQTTQKNLRAFNDFSQARYQQVHKHFETHTKLLREVKTDLDSAFIKLRKVKAKLQAKYPEEMKKALEKYPPLIIDDDE
ncbi:unnamed protein product [Cunninghamella echinulata]